MANNISLHFLGGKQLNQLNIRITYNKLFKLNKKVRA